ncbi:MAG: P1 family peptidase [Nocardioides sp.]|uniref:DmpA family aminopeptidase n=1 Tax=Nocardioides sp. TaxID=35761 RepID=UPI0039E2B9D2
MPRARDYLDLPGEPGEHDAITDVTGVEVGYVTLIEDRDGGPRGPVSVRTGVTAILPRGRSGVAAPVAAAFHSLNGNGEMTGTIWLEESGSLGTPVLITNTHSVGAVHEGAIRWLIDHAPEAARQWLMPVVAETWDGVLNDINGLHVRPEHAVAALDSARGGALAEGSVGGGTGMVCYGFKGGSGTASRTVRIGGERYVVGVFVQANFGQMGELTIRGVPVGHEPAVSATGPGGVPAGAGSVIVVVATDAPLLPAQCKALARRSSLGLARTGTTGSHFSGDIFLAFSTANRGALRDDFPDPDAAPVLDTLHALPWGRIDPLHTAVVESVEEAVLNVLVAGTTMVGQGGRVVAALPVDRLVAGRVRRDP